MIWMMQRIDRIWLMKILFFSHDDTGNLQYVVAIRADLVGDFCLIF